VLSLTGDRRSDTVAQVRPKARAGRRVSLAVLALVAAGAAGCATTDVTLGAPAAFDVAPGSHRGQGREIVVVRPFRDSRTDSRCGMKKNGYNSESATVLCNAPASLIGDLIARHLALAGFRIIRDRRDASPSAIYLTGALEQIYVEPKNNYFSVEIETDVALRLRASTTAGLSTERRFYVKGNEATVFAGDEDFQRSFDAGMRRLVTSVVGAVADLAEQIPLSPAEVPAAASAAETAPAPAPTTVPPPPAPARAAGPGSAPPVNSEGAK